MARSGSEPHTPFNTDVTAWGASRGDPKTEDGCELLNFTPPSAGKQTTYPLFPKQQLQCAPVLCQQDNLDTPLPFERKHAVYRRVRS